MDNYATHTRVEVRDWLAANPRIHVHFTPTSGSWLNLVEVWFAIIDRQAIRRGVFGSVKDLNAKIRAFIDGWNDRPTPSSGPRPPTRSSRRRTVYQLQKRDTSSASDAISMVEPVKLGENKNGLLRQYCPERTDTTRYGAAGSLG